LYWGYILTFTQFLQYIVVEFTPLSFSLFPLCPYSWTSFNVSHFSIFIQDLSLHSPSYLIFLYPPSHTYQPPDRTCFTFLFSNFKKKISLLEIAIHHIFFVHQWRTLIKWFRTSPGSKVGEERKGQLLITCLTRLTWILYYILLQDNKNVSLPHPNCCSDLRSVTYYTERILYRTADMLPKMDLFYVLPSRRMHHQDSFY
jgi:hypothetical protein